MPPAIAWTELSPFVVSFTAVLINRVRVSFTDAAVSNICVDATRFTTFSPPRFANVFCSYFRSAVAAPADGRVAATTMLPADMVAVT
jgi:hypothetical protein